MNEIERTIKSINKKEAYEKYIDLWVRGLSDEVRFWTNEFYKDREWWEKQRGYSPYQYEYDFSYEEYVDGDEVKFLDVGSGPISDCGSRSDKIKVDIEAVDPLAYVYEKLKEVLGFDTKITIQYAEVEALTDKYSENQFDIVHIRNALDHSHNPLLGIMQMLYVVKVGGKVLMNHLDNEAQNAKYKGLHQWNLQVIDGAFLLWNREIKINVSNLLKQYCEIKCISGKDYSNDRMHMVILKKKTEVPLFIDENKAVREKKVYEKLLDILFVEEIERKRWKIEEEQACVKMLTLAIQNEKLGTMMDRYKNIGIYGKNEFSYILISEAKKRNKAIVFFDRAGSAVSCAGSIGVEVGETTIDSLDALIISPVDYYNVVKNSIPDRGKEKVVFARDFVTA